MGVLLSGVDERGYRGGVTYCEPGVGGAELGARPSSFRCAGVRGISERSSFPRTRGKRAIIMFDNSTSRMTQRNHAE